MNELKLSNDALDDLQEIWDFLLTENQTAAVRVVKQLTNKFDMLARFPSAGRERNELIVGLRSLAVARYVVFYQPTKNGVEIVRVLHGSRDAEQAFAEQIGEAK